MVYVTLQQLQPPHVANHKTVHPMKKEGGGGGGDMSIYVHADVGRSEKLDSFIN